LLIFINTLFLIKIITSELRNTYWLCSSNVLMQSIANGKKYGLATVCGLISGCLVHTSLVAFGVSAIIKANDSLFFILKLFGALYLLYLAYKVYKSSSEVSLTNDEVPKKYLFSF